MSSSLWLHGLSMKFSGQEYWSGLLSPSPGALPDPGMGAMALMSPSLAGGSLPLVPPGKLRTIYMNINRVSSWLRNQMAWLNLNPSFTISNSVTRISDFLCNPLSTLIRCDVNNTSLKWLSCRMRNYCLVLVDMQLWRYCYHRCLIPYYQFHVDGHIEWLQFFFSYITH